MLVHHAYAEDAAQLLAPAAQCQVMVRSHLQPTLQCTEAPKSNNSNSGRDVGELLFMHYNAAHLVLSTVLIPRSNQLNDCTCPMSGRFGVLLSVQRQAYDNQMHQYSLHV